jgi:hypothetical protein
LKRQEDIYLSEFRVVKCKKCDAALTEIVGEKLTNCVQCGYSFNIPESKNKRPHAISGKTKDSPEYKRYLKKIQNKNFSSYTFNEQENISSEGDNSFNDLIQLETKHTEDNTTESLKPKTSIIGSIVKWYFIIFISISVLSQCFNR